MPVLQTAEGRLCHGLDPNGTKSARVGHLLLLFSRCLRVLPRNGPLPIHRPQARATAAGGETLERECREGARELRKSQMTLQQWRRVSPQELATRRQMLGRRQEGRRDARHELAWQRAGQGRAGSREGVRARLGNMAEHAPLTSNARWFLCASMQNDNEMNDEMSRPWSRAATALATARTLPRQPMTRWAWRRTAAPNAPPPSAAVPPQRHLHEGAAARRQ